MLQNPDRWFAKTNLVKSLVNDFKAKGRSVVAEILHFDRLK
jgi:hypothetical protein